jgi:hypothetical protein
VLQSEFYTESDLLLPLSVYRENEEIKLIKSQSNKGKYKGFWKRAIRNKIIKLTDRKINLGRE